MAAERAEIIDATYRVIERTADVDPTVRAILREAGLSTPAFYRHFRSKDELFVTLLDDGRRRLVSSIERRLARETTGAGRVRAWIRGVMAQAAHGGAAARTRPFLANIDRLVTRYPEEHRVSEELLIAQLVEILSVSDDLETADARRDAVCIYHLAFGALSWHLRHGRAPSPAEIERVVDFATRSLRSGAVV